MKVKASGDEEGARRLTRRATTTGMSNARVKGSAVFAWTP
jgi:hypothetical protein